MPTATPVLLPTEQPHHLHHRYDGENAQQPCHLAIDLEDGTVTCDWNPERGSNALPAAVYHRRILWLPIPTLLTRYANQLVTEALPYARRILDDATIEWDGNNHVGRLGDAAAAALEELRKHIAENYPDDADDLVVHEYPAGGQVDDVHDLCNDTLELTADTTDADLPAAAERLEKLLIETAGPTAVVTGALDAVTMFRARLRAEVRAELEEVAAELDRLTRRRDTLIRTVRGWGDSLRAIAQLADLSHTQVDRIANEEPPGEYRVQQHQAEE